MHLAAVLIAAALIVVSSAKPLSHEMESKEIPVLFEESSEESSEDTIGRKDGELSLSEIEAVRIAEQLIKNQLVMIYVDRQNSEIDKMHLNRKLMPEAKYNAIQEVNIQKGDEASFEKETARRHRLLVQLEEVGRRLKEIEDRRLATIAHCKKMIRKFPWIAKEVKDACVTMEHKYSSMY